MDGHREELGVGGAIPHLGEDGGELVGKALYVRTGTLALFKVMKRREMHRAGRVDGGVILTKPTMLEHMASQVGINTL